MTDLSFKQRFINAQQDIKKIDKDAINPHFKSKYTSLPSILEQFRPVFLEHELFYRTKIDGNKLITYVEDQHSTEHYSTEMPLLEVATMQKLGSSITYAQRYSLLLVMGVAAGMDDDGNDASTKDDPKPSQPKVEADPKQRACTTAEANTIRALMQATEQKDVVVWINNAKILTSIQALDFWERLIAKLKEPLKK